MNRKGIYWVLLLLGAGRLLAGCSKNPHRLYTTLQDQAEVRQLKQFVAEKKSQANAATNEAVPGFAPFFAAAEKGDWLAVSNDFEELRAHAGQYSHAGNADDERLRGPRWEAVKEIWGAFDAFSEGEEKYTAAFARDIIVSIPAGSVYFGGTDPGRFVVTALCPSQVTGDPFFVLTQNALADGPYLDYLRQIYGNQLRLPDKSQALQCFQEYTAEHGKTQVSGQVSVMGINGLLAKNIFDQNPGREFYLEESFPLDWMYPQLEPHGLILKIDRQAMATLPTEVVQADHDYWAKYVLPMIGDWLHDQTPVAAVADFAAKTFGRQDFSGFQGDRRFIRNAYANRMFSKLRSSIAGVYAWRASQPGSAADKQRMATEADFAFRQAWALCPYSPEAMYRYVSFLVAQNRIEDAIIVAEATAKFPSCKGDEQVKQLVRQLKTWHQGK